MSFPRLVGCVVAGLVLSADACAQALPQWELGAGLGFIAAPYYRGAETTHHLLLPLPYFVYRGERLHADRGGVRGDFFSSPNVDVQMTLAASPPVSASDSGKDSARTGMPKLKATFEVGPAVQWHVWRRADERVQLIARFPLRMGITFPGRPQSTGWVSDPNINVDLRAPFGVARGNLGFLLGPVFGSRTQHAYFYDVAPQYARAERPAFSARAGFGGWRAVAAFSAKVDDRMWVGAFARYDWLDGAVFRDSPLVKRAGRLSFGIGAAWIFAQATRTVVTDE